MAEHQGVNYSAEANRGILRYFLERELPNGGPLSPGSFWQGPPDSVKNPYFNLGTHPDLVERLWDKLTINLPAGCRWVVNRNPCLIHPVSGIIFGFVGGTSTLALRLPPAEREQALRVGAKRVLEYPGGHKIDLDKIGEEWVFGRWFKEEPEWCLAAYLYAEATSE